MLDAMEDQSSFQPLTDAFLRVRNFSESLVADLEPEDMVVQTVPDISPTKWHLAHTTWFFETFVLKRWEAGFAPFDPHFEVLFNSYYNGVGEQYPRHQRGLLARPTVSEIKRYRADVNARVCALLPEVRDPEIDMVMRVGLNHEEQHQELMLTDIKHVMAFNPLKPVFSSSELEVFGTAPRLTWKGYPSGVREIGAKVDASFVFDNETPRHRVFLEAFEIAEREVTNGEYLEFIQDGGYSRPELWLSEGWTTLNREGWVAPMYWERRGDAWWQMTLHGMREVDPGAPVTHVSYFEADAFARWAGARLPTEAEWEIASADHRIEDGHFVESGIFQPMPSHGEFFGSNWEWTASSYAAYPGYRALEGALGEYNGKFMVNQYVLRGGSCATSASHVRATYRNFFPTSARWQFSGIRLARCA